MFATYQPNSQRRSPLTGSLVHPPLAPLVLDSAATSIRIPRRSIEPPMLPRCATSRDAMDRAKELTDAATKSMGEAKGSVGDVRVVSVLPELKNERPEATIVLLAGKQFSTVS
jgi:hypothetical protein